MSMPSGTPERPQDEVRFGSDDSPDWDHFLDSYFHVTLLGRRGDELTPLVKTTPGFNHGQPYFVLTSSDPGDTEFDIDDSGELLQTYVSGRQAIRLAPPGVSLLVDDFSLRADGDDIARLRTDVELLGPQNMTLEDLMIRFGFTREDLEANRAGTLSDRQRTRLGRRLGDGTRERLVVAIGASLSAFAITFGNLGPDNPTNWTYSVLAGVSVCVILAARWSYLFRYPLGHNRVKLMIAETGQTQHTSKIKKLSRVGMGAGGRWLDVAIPEGMLVRLYWNAGPAGETLVHSIEPARVGDAPNTWRRDWVTRIVYALCILALIPLGMFLSSFR